MKSSEIATLLRPFKAVVNPRALSPSARVIEIGPKLRANCEWAHLEVQFNNTETPVNVDGNSFIAVVDSLADEHEFTYTVKDNTLEWRCGHAAGKFAIVPEIALPAYSRRVKNPWPVSDDFRKVLQLGSLSAGTSALATVGLFGVAINIRDTCIQVMASDNVTMSLSEISETKLQGPATVTFTPEGIDLLALLLTKAVSLEFDDKAAYVTSSVLKARVNQINPLTQDIGQTVGNFEGAEIKVALPRDRIAAFVKRAAALAEAKRHTAVWISAKKGRLTTTFSEGIATAEEDYLIEGLDVPDLAPVQVDAGKLARALASSDFLVLDHIERHVLVLHGDKPKFRYLIAARRS